MKNFLILLGFLFTTLTLQAQPCGTVFNDHVSSHYPAADLQVAAFYANAVCQAYEYIDAGLANPPDRQDAEHIQSLNNEAWTTIMTTNKINTAFAGKSNLKSFFVDGVVSRGVGRCIAEIDDMAYRAPDYEAFLEDLIRLIASHFFLTLSPPEQAQISTLIALIEDVYQFADSKVQGITGKDNPLKLNWWQRWGRCVAGTIGGAVGGGIAGGGLGVAVSGIGVIPGAIGGAIGGALGGAAEFCGE